MSIRPYFALAHIASQICHRYLSVNVPRSLCSQEGDSNTGIERWTRQEWYDFIYKEIHKPSGLVPGLSRYFALYDQEGLILLDKIHNHLRWCESESATYKLLCDPLYPGLLKEIPQPPLGLTILGDSFLLFKPKVSVIGSRRTADVVIHESYRLGYLLAKIGITVVSGGAFGCDIATHMGVVSYGKTPVPAVVIFANGLKQLFPRSNQEKFDRIRQGGGALVSERLWDQTPTPYDFPIRNRIISGLSMWTVVMGATRTSGAMITARLALDQGREVIVYFPDKEKYYCEGAQILVDDGARYFTSSEDLCSQILKV